MNIIIGVLLAIFVIIAILLVLVILAQDDGTDGAGIIFGSAASQQYGARKGNIVTKTTGILATIFLVSAFTLSFLFKFDNNISLEIPVPEDETSAQWWSTETNTGNTDDIPLDAPAQSINESDIQPDGSPIDIQPDVSPVETTDTPVNSGDTGKEAPANSRTE